MSKLVMGVQKFLRDEEGTEVVEWALVAGLVVAVGAVVFTTVGERAYELLYALAVGIGADTTGLTAP